MKKYLYKDFILSIKFYLLLSKSKLLIQKNCYNNNKYY